MDNKSEETLGERIRQSYARLGLSQPAAAKLLGVKQSNLSQWVTGARTPGADNLRAIVEAFEVDGHWLVTGKQINSRGAPADERVIAAKWMEKAAKRLREEAAKRQRGEATRPLPLQSTEASDELSERVLEYSQTEDSAGDQDDVTPPNVKRPDEGQERVR